MKEKDASKGRRNTEHERPANILIRLVSTELTIDAEDPLSGCQRGSRNSAPVSPFGSTGNIFGSVGNICASTGNVFPWPDGAPDNISPYRGGRRNAIERMDSMPILNGNHVNGGKRSPIFKRRKNATSHAPPTLPGVALGTLFIEQLQQVS